MAARIHACRKLCVGRGVVFPHQFALAVSETCHKSKLVLVFADMAVQAKLVSARRRSAAEVGANSYRNCLGMFYGSCSLFG